MITKYGYDVLFTITALCIILIILTVFFVEPKVFKYSIIGFSLIFFGFSINFFRDPNRITPIGKGLVISPADGKVILIKRITENEFLHSDASQISIFMSPIDVHVNRIPISGVVKHFRYVKGKYFAAFEDKSSEKNEQTIIGLETSKGKVLFKQIAGFIARRIVCDLREGNVVKAGERFGMIKFGSRVDVFVPAEAQMKIKVGDVAAAGETVLAELP